MKKTVGYIVCDSGGVKGLVKEVLWSMSTATLFASRKDAKNALKRTQAYSNKRGYDWGVGAWWIVRVVST